jgi:3-phosphoshikimate 1-carboxyvinyltransferase
MKLEVRRSKPLKGEFRLPPDRVQAQSALLLALLAPGRTVLRGWQSTPEWEHSREWLSGIGVSTEPDADGLVVSPPSDLRTRPEFVIDRFLPVVLASGIVALAAGFSHSERPVRVLVPTGAVKALTAIREALREAGWISPSQDAEGVFCWTFHGRTPPLREPVARHPSRRFAWTLAALAAGEGLRFLETPDLPDPLANVLGQFGLEVAEIREEVSPEEEEMRRRMARMRGAAPKPPTVREIPSVQGLPTADVRLHGDVDLAGWCAVVACLRRGTDALLPDVALPPGRSGLFMALRRMGGDIEVVRRSESRGAASGDLRVKHGRLVGRKFDGEDLPGLAGWAGLLAAAAVGAEAETVLSGLSELREEGQDDLALLAEGLRAFGVAVGLYPDGLVLRGEEQPGSELVQAGGRELPALALHALASSTAGKTEIVDADPLAVVWPHLLRVLATDGEAT